MKPTCANDIASTIRGAVVKHYARLWRYAFSLTADRAEADDLVQNAVLRALEQTARYSEQQKVDRWLFTIMHRLWLNDLRARKVRRGRGIHQIDTLDIVDEKPVSELGVFAQQVLARVMTLPERQRAAVLLVYIEGYKCTEAADMLGIPAGTVTGQLTKARNALCDFSDARERAAAGFPTKTAVTRSPEMSSI